MSNDAKTTKILEQILAEQKQISKQFSIFEKTIERIGKALNDHFHRIASVERLLEDFTQSTVKHFGILRSDFVEMREEISEDLSKIKVEITNLGYRVMHLENSNATVVRDVEAMRSALDENKNFGREVILLDKRLTKLEKKIEKLESR